MNDVLLTVSGNIPADIEEQIASGKRPLTDYIAMAKSFKADLIDYQKAEQQSGWFGRLIQKIAGNNALLAWACYKNRRRYRLIFTDGEQVAIPLALLLKFANFGPRARHFAICHILSVGKKMLFFDWLKIASHIDLFFVYATWQKQFIQKRWQLPAERVIFTPFMVDDEFFSLAQSGAEQENLYASLNISKDQPMICAVGREFRDYPTLLKAVEGLDVHVIVTAASAWSKRSDSTADQSIPANVTVSRFTLYELRDIYAISQFLVMPLYNVDFQAGVTALLEGMAMEKAVICSRTPGQTDVVVEGETGIYVPPGDVPAMRQAIQKLLADPELAAQMGRNGRKRIETQMNLKAYVDRLNHYVNPVNEV